jgi:hypothetical protein
MKKRRSDIVLVHDEHDRLIGLGRWVDSDWETRSLQIVESGSERELRALLGRKYCAKPGDMFEIVCWTDGQDVLSQ